MDPYSWFNYLNVSNELIAKPNGKVGAYIVLLVVLIALNAYFAASELAIVSLNDAKIEKMASEGNKKAILLDKMTKQPTTFLSTIQIGVTLSGFLSSAVAADTFADYIVYWLRNIPIDLDILRIISIFVITILLSFFTLVFGELLPKRIAMKNPERVAFGIVNSLNIIYVFLKPLVFLVSKAVNAIANIFGIKEDDGGQEYSEEEIRILVDAGKEKGFIEEEEKQMINNVFDFNDRTVSEVLTHRIQMDALDIKSSLKDTITLFKETEHSRIPVYEDTIDNIVGIIHIKDLTELFFDKKKQDKFNLKKYLRDVIYVYENKKCDDLFDDMQKSKIQVAIVLDERGGTFGMVTMEDLLESIVGNIQDEFDDEEKEIEIINKNHYIVNGDVLIEDISKLINIELDDSENNTIAGLVMDLLGHVPNEEDKEKVSLNNIDFNILEIQEHTIKKIEIIINELEAESED